MHAQLLDPAKPRRRRAYILGCEAKALSYPGMRRASRSPTDRLFLLPIRKRAVVPARPLAMRAIDLLKDAHMPEVLAQCFAADGATIMQFGVELPYCSATHAARRCLVRVTRVRLKPDAMRRFPIFPVVATRQL